MRIVLRVLGLELVDLDWTTDPTADPDDTDHSFGGTVGIAAILASRALDEREGSIEDVQ